MATLQEELIDTMHELEDEYAGLLEMRAANRRTLRDLMMQGKLNATQVKDVETTYVPRKRRNGDDES